MQKTGVFSILSHSEQNRVTLGNETSEISLSDIKALPYESLSSNRLVLYGGCETAKGGYSGDNMVNNTFYKGAKSVIGFQTKTETNVFGIGINKWMKNFYESSYEYNLTLYQACYRATEVTEFFGDYYETDSWYIAGSSSQRLNS